MTHYTSRLFMMDMVSRVRQAGLMHDSGRVRRRHRVGHPDAVFEASFAGSLERRGA